MENEILYICGQCGDTTKKETLSCSECWSDEINPHEVSVEEYDIEDQIAYNEKQIREYDEVDDDY